MSKIKVIDLAKELRVSGKKLTDALVKDNIPVKNVMSYLSDEQVVKIRENKNKYISEINTTTNDQNSKPVSSSNVQQGQNSNYRNQNNQGNNANFNRNTQGNTNFNRNTQGNSSYNQTNQNSSNFNRNAQGNSNFNRNTQGNSNYNRTNQNGSNFNRNAQGNSNFNRNTQGNSNYNRTNQNGSNFNRNAQGNSNFNRNTQGNSNYNQTNQNGSNFNRNAQGNSNFNRNAPGNSNFNRNTQGGSNYHQQNQGSTNFNRNNQGSGNFNSRTNSNSRGEKTTPIAPIASQPKKQIGKKINKRNERTKKREIEFEFQRKATIEKKIAEKIKFDGGITVNELAKQTNIEAAEIIKKLFLLGIMVTINSVLEKDAVEIICSDYNIEVEEVVRIDETDLSNFDAEDEEQDLQERPPIVTIMGHVDHGKTSLLDAIRKSKVASGEKGGITQHIGAYQIDHNGQKVTFIDTPGHEAFTSMRARGSQVTDIVIIVVSAEDSVMPQTIESIDHAKAANVPILVAVNKIDKPNANPDRVMTDLSTHGILAEEWGGDVIFTKVSAHTGEGLDELLENILLVAEVEDLKANKNRHAYGKILEAKLDKGRGVVATLLVQKGTLNIGDPIVAGASYGKVRTIQNDLGERITTALPSMPVEITGLNDVPSAGDIFTVFDNEKYANKVGQLVQQKENEENRKRNSVVNVASLFSKIEENDLKQLPVIIKADAQGSVEALSAVLNKIDVSGVRVNIISGRTGAITESDVQLAKASSAIVIGFNVRPNPQIRKIAEQEGVDVRLHNIIYKVAEEIEEAMKGTLDPVFEEVVVGNAKVVETFKISKIGTIAGTIVEEGRIYNNSDVRIMRDGIIIYTGKINTLRRYQNEVKEVIVGQDCGLTVENFNDFKIGDMIELFTINEVKVK